MKNHLLPVLLVAIFAAGALFMIVSNENTAKAPSISSPSLPSSSMKATIIDSDKATTTEQKIDY